jgi:hypothetical protein
MRTDGADVVGILLRDPNRVSLVVVDDDAGVDLGGRQEVSVPRARTVLHARSRLQIGRAAKSNVP